MFKQLLSLFGVALCVNAYASINLTSLGHNGFSDWKHKPIMNETVYQVTSYKGRVALKAVSDGAASGLVIEKQIDLLETPYVNWSWLVEKALSKLDERSKDGDDYAARVYVIVDGGLLPWEKKAISYVWSSSQGQGQVWDNAFAGSNVKMVSVRGQESNIGQWYDEKRNVYKDLIKYFGDKGSDEANQKSYRYIDTVAIMTDTDNSRGHAEAFYGDIIFSEE